MVMKRWFIVFLTLLVVSGMLLSACVPAATEAPAEEAAIEEAPEEETASEETSTEAEAEPAAPEEEVAEEPAAEEPTEEMSKVGGTLRLAMAGDPDTFDPHKMASAATAGVMSFIGASLVFPDENGYHPYLAESWEISEDGLTYTFKLREDVTFHNGDPMTAEDVAFTYTRALAPETASPAAAAMLGSVTSVTALDDYTIAFTLSAPSYPFLFGLSDPAYLGIMSKSYTEEVGDDIGNKPMSVGPYKFVEYQIGERVVLERNPDFNWGSPAWQNTGPWNFETIEFRIIADISIIQAGLEAGEIDYASIQPQDVQLMQDVGMEIVQSPTKGIIPYVTLNNSKPPFDDINVRKAFNMAMDREIMIDILVQGNGVEQFGPISPGVVGYWPEVEQYGYSYDMEAAKALMEEAGYTYNADGMAEKDGEVLSLTLLTAPLETWVKPAEVIQQQLRDLGVEIIIEQGDPTVLMPQVFAGEYQLSMFGMSYPEADLMYVMFHTSQIGGMNFAYVSDPVMDEILDRTRTSVDPDQRQQAVNEAQQYITENAFIIPLYTAMNFAALNPRVKGTYWSDVAGVMFNSAYIEE